MAHSSTANDISEAEGLRVRVVQLLNQQLADTVDLRSQARHAALNVSGRYILELIALFDGLARDLRECIDLIAGRINALGGYAVATVRVAAHQSNLREYPLDALDAHEHLQALLSSYSRYEVGALNTMKAVKELNDSDTGQLLQGIAVSIERNLWLLEAHLEGIAVGLHGRKLPGWTPAFENHFRSMDRDQKSASSQR